MVDDASSACGSDPERLASLLGIGIPTASTEHDRRTSHTAQLLVEMLAGRLPVSVPSVASGDSTTRSARETSACLGPPIGDLLFGPSTELPTLRIVKEYGKQLARAATVPTQQAAATAIYYGAIAAALVWHHRALTHHSGPELENAFGMLEAKPWMEPRLKALLGQARKACPPAAPA